MPSIERVRFVSSGTEAAMSAVRVARAATGRDRILKFEGCYHGHADAFLVKAGSGALTLGTPTSPGVTRAASADTLVASYNDLDSVRQSFAANRGQIAAVIVEPIAGNMGVVPPADGFLRGLREICTRRGRAADLRRSDLGLSSFRRRRAGTDRRASRPDLSGQDHRRRPAGRRLRRPRGPDGPRLARRSGLSGRHALGQSARDDRRTLVSESAHAEALRVALARSVRGSRLVWRTRRARPAWRCR